MTTYAFLENAAVLLALCWLLAFNARYWKGDRPLPVQCLTGLWFGAAAVVGMMMPIVTQPGIFFDARSMVLSMAGLFGGPFAGAVAALLAGSYRIWLGGAGVWVGLFNVIFPVLLGLGYRYAHQRGKLDIGLWQLLAFGLLLHLSVLGSLLLLPGSLGTVTLQHVATPIVLTLPLATALLGLLIGDLLRREQLERAMRISESRLQAITQAIPDLLMVLDEEGRYLEIICSEPELLHADSADLVGSRLQDVMPAEQASRFLAFIGQTLASDKPQIIEYSMQTPRGPKVFEGRAQHLDTRLSSKRAVVWLSRDITERINAEQDRRVAAIAFETQQALIITDANQCILQVNRAFSEISGYSAEEAVGKDTRLLASGRHGAEFYAAMWSRIQETGTWQGEIWNRRKNGEVFPEWLTISTVLDARNAVSHYVAAFTDITERKAAEEQIHNLAFYDPLTSLPNRRLLLDRLQQALAASGLSQTFGALMFIDLDNFKNINDLHGHQAGDRVLCLSATRLEKQLRAGDTVARLGGDEFVVMLERLEANAEDAAAEAEQIAERILSSLAQPYQMGALSLHSSASIGIVLFGSADSDAEELMKRADMSMYEAKVAGKNALRFFDPRMQQSVQERLRLEDEIRQGLAAGEFILHFQAQIEQTRGVVGAEVLVRWQHPQRGLLTPVHFIGPAERAGLIQQLDFLVLRHACEQLAIWQQQPRLAALTLSVNLSASLLYENDFVENLLSLLASSGADPRRLKLELTESLLLDDMQAAIVRMDRLKNTGIRFSIDDFGTGYSSMAYLQQLPLDQLKIDQSFIRGLPEDSSSLTIVRATCALATGLKLEVIAEGVETETQRDLLLSNGCTMFQGYLFSRPVPLEQFEQLLQPNSLTRPE